MKKLISVLIALCLAIAVPSSYSSAAELTKGAVKLEKINAANELGLQYDDIVSVEQVDITKSAVTDGIKAGYKNPKTGETGEIPVNATLEKVTLSKDVKSASSQTAYILTAKTAKVTGATGSRTTISFSGKIRWYDITGGSNELISVAGARAGQYDHAYGEYFYGSEPNVFKYKNGQWFTESFFDNSHSGLKGNSFGLRMVSFDANEIYQYFEISTP